MTLFRDVVSISTGKDSVATACLAIERADRSGRTPLFIFSDTGNEHHLTIAHLDYLEGALGVTINRVRADFTARFAHRRATIRAEWVIEKRRKRHRLGCERRIGCDCPITISPPVSEDLIDRAIELMHPTGNPFLDLCMLKGRFPSRRAQFCTDELKIVPINALIEPILATGSHVISWIGERAEESLVRAKKPPIQRIHNPAGGDLILYRPIHKWKAADTFAIAERHGLKHNPLYTMGMGRVGCMPCINCKKDELAQIDQRCPEEINRIREWEIIVAAVSRRGDSTFFPAPMVPGDDSDTLRASIDKAVAWARTSRGGKQFDMIQRIAREQADAEGAMCESAYGLCE